VNVAVPPRIGPFTFGELIEGVRTQVQCVIQQGDPPLNLTWLKDEHPISYELGIHINQDEFSSTLIIPVVGLQHSGNYTCIASNQAKEARQSSKLIVSGQSCSEQKCTSSTDGTRFFCDLMCTCVCRLHLQIGRVF
jgi:Immunoglobulin domain